MIKKLIVVITLFSTLVSYAQKSNASAYSFFGIGDQNNAATVHQSSMAGIGVAMSDPFRLNLSNPAAAASLRFTSFGIAFNNKNIWAKDENDQQRAATTYLSYLTMGIPLGSNAGMQFGIIPNSTVGYSLTSNVFENDVLQEVSLYDGEGGTNKVFLGLGIRLFKGFSAGIQGNYLFGNIENSITNQLKDANLATRYITSSKVNGLSLNTGFQYEKTLKNGLKMHLGGNFDLDSDFDMDNEELLYSLSFAQGETPRDTLLVQNSKGIFNTPLKSTIGIGLGKPNVWYAGINYSKQKPLQIQGGLFNNYSKVVYDDFSKFAIGGYYTPKFNSITSYWERVTYRAGLRFEKTGLLIDPTGNGTNFTAIDDFGISFGVGLPMSNQLSSLDLGFEVGKRGKAENGLVRENYVNFRLSLSLTAKWFEKLKIY